MRSTSPSYEATKVSTVTVSGLLRQGLGKDLLQANWCNVGNMGSIENKTEYEVGGCAVLYTACCMLRLLIAWTDQ